MMLSVELILGRDCLEEGSATSSHLAIWPDKGILPVQANAVREQHKSLQVVSCLQ